MDTMEAYREVIKENIEYDIMRQQLGYNAVLLDDILDIMVDTVCSSKRMIRIGGEDYPREVVKNRLLKINGEHIGYVIDCLKENTTKVRNIRAYLLTSLYNAPTTINSYYTALVNHDLYGGGYRDYNPYAGHCPCNGGNCHFSDALYLDENQSKGNRRSNQPWYIKSKYPVAEYNGKLFCFLSFRNRCDHNQQPDFKSAYGIPVYFCLNFSPCTIAVEERSRAVSLGRLLNLLRCHIL